MKMTGTPRHRDLWRSHGGSQHGPCVETYTIPEAQFDAFCRSVEAPLLATIETQDAEIKRLRAENTKLREAIAPFQRYAKALQLSKSRSDDSHPVFAIHESDVAVTYADLRRAAAVKETRRG